jgi:S1-C subfamily serine protease
MKTACALLFLSAPSLLAQDLADVFASVSPGVVTIRCTVSTITRGDTPHVERKMVIGTGVLLDRDGTVLTAAHVVELADSVDVEFLGGEMLAAKVAAVEVGADLALVRVTGELPADARPCEVGDSSSVRVGNQVFVVGAPLGMEHTLTAGHISAVRRNEAYLGGMRYVEHFQTDAAINPGN